MIILCIFNENIAHDSEHRSVVKVLWELLLLKGNYHYLNSLPKMSNFTTCYISSSKLVVKLQLWTEKLLCKVSAYNLNKKIQQKRKQK